MPTDLIRYDLLVQDALRSVVRKVLSDTAHAGLIGDHHFNIAFKTQAPGVIVPPQIKSRYPEEMSIILQHEFWDLVVTQEAFEVSLNFSRKPERLTVPFDAITGFNDPSVPFGFKLEPRASEELAEPRSAPAPGPARREGAPAAAPAPAGAKPVPGRPVEPKVEKPAAPAARTPEPAEGSKVVSIDAFRKK